MPTLTGRAPYRWDHELVIGDTYQPAVLEVLDDDGVTPIDLTGATVAVQLRSEPGSALILEPTGSLVVAASGTLTWSSTAAATAALTPGKAKIGVRITYASGEVRTLLEGTVTIRRGVLP